MLPTVCGSINLPKESSRSFSNDLTISVVDFGILEVRSKRASVQTTTMSLSNGEETFDPMANGVIQIVHSQYPMECGDHSSLKSLVVVDGVFHFPSPLSKIPATLRHPHQALHPRVQALVVRQA